LEAEGIRRVGNIQEGHAGGGEGLKGPGAGGAVGGQEGGGGRRGEGVVARELGVREGRERGEAEQGKKRAERMHGFGDKWVGRGGQMI